jgi:hypothetical protein
MMSYLSDWRHLSRRISGLVEAGKLYGVLTRGSGDKSIRCTRAHCTRVVDLIDDFGKRHSDILSAEARQCLKDSISDIRPLTIIDPNQQFDTTRDFTMSALIMLTAFESEMSFILSDNQAEIRSRSERAFEHLQRSIVADSTIKARWKAAFDAGETACEKLGAVHLLSHGIWAFKAYGEGARTDLVYETKIEQSEAEAGRQWSEGLVLTEWKKAKCDEKPETIFDNARKQAHQYTKGILAGFELAAYRYIIIVSERPVSLPSDVTIDGFTYRHLNIAVDPPTPSKHLARS